MFEFLKRKKQDNQFLLKKANDLYIKKKYASALEIYARILKNDSKNFPAIANTATSYFELQKYEQSIPFFRETIVMDSSNPWWHNYLSQSLQKCGDFLGSLECAWQAVLLGKDDNAHHMNLAYSIYETYDELGRKEADTYLEKWYKSFPQNPIAEHCYKSFFYDEKYVGSRREYVEELFDFFASDFDKVLQDLHYDSPKVIADYLHKYFIQKGKNNISILDLGCGSGLCGKYIKKKLKKSHLTGVDISSKMLQEAECKNVYDVLVKNDISDCFSGEKNLFDAVVLSDVLTYFGALEKLFEKVDSLLHKEGVFVFSISENKSNNMDYFLMPSSRFVHSKNYVDSLIKKYKFSIKISEKKILRKEGDKDVEGIIYLVEKK